MDHPTTTNRKTKKRNRNRTRLWALTAAASILLLSVAGTAQALPSAPALPALPNVGGLVGADVGASTPIGKADVSLHDLRADVCADIDVDANRATSSVGGLIPVPLPATPQLPAAQASACINADGQAVLDDTTQKIEQTVQEAEEAGASVWHRAFESVRGIFDTLFGSLG